MSKILLSFILLITLFIPGIASQNEATQYVYVKLKTGASGQPDPEIKIIDSLYVDSLVNAFKAAKKRNSSCTPDSNLRGDKIELYIPEIGNTTLQWGCTGCCGADSGRAIRKLIYRSILEMDHRWAFWVCWPSDVAPEGCQSSNANPNSPNSNRNITPTNQTNPGAYSLDGKLVPDNVPISSPGVQKGKTPKVILPNSNTRDK